MHHGVGLGLRGILPNNTDAASTLLGVNLDAFLFVLSLSSHMDAEERCNQVHVDQYLAGAMMSMWLSQRMY